MLQLFSVHRGMAVAMETQQLPAIRHLSAPTKSKKSEAMPKHSLFGTALEVFDPEEREAINKIDLKTQRIPSGRKYVQHYVVPEFIKNHLKGIYKYKVHLNLHAKLYIVDLISISYSVLDQNQN